MPPLPIRNGVNGLANIATVTLPDGTTAVAHVTIDQNGNVIGLATDATLQALAALLGGTLKTAPQSNALRVSATGSLAAAYNGAISLAANITAGAALTLAVDGMATCVAQITGTWVGSVTWSASIDGGTTYFPISVTPIGSGGGASVSSVTANGQWEFSASGMTHVQAQISTITSGSASILLAAANGAKIARVKAPSTDALPVLDSNNAAFSTALAMSSGSTYAAARSIGVICTIAGNIVLTLSSGGTITLPVYPGWQTFPFATTAFAFSGGAAGNVYNLN